MDKKELRKKYIDVRHHIIDKDKKSLIIKDKLLSILDKYDSIGIYVSMDDEVSTGGIIEELLKSGKTILVPKVVDFNIHFYQIHSLNELSMSNSKYHIREPISNNIYKQPISAMIIPGIVFDASNNRLGFGGGYYDKYLATYSGYKIGICFKEQLIDKIHTDEWDIKMDIVITD